MGSKVDKKAEFLIKKYCEEIYNHKFDEMDLLLFLILIRQHISSKDEKYIRDFGDVVAHRMRNVGIAMKAISNAKANGYKRIEKNGQFVVKGYEGVEDDEWKKEWIRIGKRYGYSLMIILYGK